MSGPFTSPVAYSIPFNGADPLAVSAGITADNVFDAILEAKTDALNNDRYPVQASYGGNATAGRYLEIYPSIASDSANGPLIIPELSRISSYTAGCVANSTFVLTIRNLTTATDLLNITFTASKEVNATGLSVSGVNANDHLGFYIKSGSANKPFIRVWFNTIT